MLMDEPFGAVDPINRERLQNEFLRLQAEVRKTILFVTHDIDEAIKMGDRIAILREGGQLAQYATPAELLMAPGRRLRRGLRRRRPGAEAAGADAGLRHRPLGGAARLRRPGDRRGAGEARRRRGPARAGRRLRPPARSAGSPSPTSPPRPCRPSPTPAPSRSSSATTSCATRSPTCCRPRRRYAPVVDAERADRRRALGRDHLRVPDLARGADRGAPRGRAAAGLMAVPRAPS